jgi:hypothetical protein
MPLHKVTFEDASKLVIVTDTGLVSHQIGFSNNTDRLRGFQFNVDQPNVDVTTAFAVQRQANIAGMFASLHAIGDGTRVALSPVISFQQVTKYHRRGEDRFVPDNAVAALLDDVDFYADGAIYLDVAARHGINEEDWESITLGFPQAITWKEARGFTASVHGEELIAASKTV